MPAATTPLGKPSAAKPSGFTMPTGLNRQTAPAKSETEAEEEDQGPKPVHIGISAVALIIALLFAWTVYQGDQVPNRTSDYMFGQPVAEGSANSSGSSASDDSDDEDDDNAAGEDDEDEDE